MDSRKTGAKVLADKTNWRMSMVPRRIPRAMQRTGIQGRVNELRLMKTFLRLFQGVLRSLL
jgi:hypothetical protein